MLGDHHDGVGEAQLRVIKLASPASFVVGVQSLYVITVVNLGTAATDGPRGRGRQRAGGASRSGRCRPGVCPADSR